MKYSKLVLFIFFNLFLISKTTATIFELYFDNNSSVYSITVMYYPISMNFNASDVMDFKCPDYPQNYLRRDQVSPGQIYFYYNNGISVIKGSGNNTTDTYKSNWTVPPGGSIGFNYNKDNEVNGCYGSFCQGVYKAIISWVPYHPDNLLSSGSDTVDIEWDSSPEGGDVHIIFRDDSGNPRVSYSMGDAWPIIDITDSQCNKYIKYWHPYEPAPPGWLGNRNKNFGNFTIYDYSNPTIFPQDARRDCNRTDLPGNPIANQNGQSDYRSGNLTLNLNIQSQAWTPIQSQRKDFPTFINILPGTSAGPILSIGMPNIGYSINLLLLDDPWYTSNNNAYTVLNNYNIINLIGMSTIYVFNHNQFNMYSGSHLNGTNTLPPPAVQIYQGGTFCNYGGTISSNVWIYFWGRVVNTCSGIQNFLVQDSAKLVLKDTATWELADSSVIRFDGNQTALIMKPYSEIKFGVGAKLVFTNGARLSANNCKFTSLVGDSTWDGIYLNDLAQDTLTGCTIENASNGINIINRNNRSLTYSTIITGCTFTNTTSATQLNNAIYANNSNNTLIQNDSIISNTAQGYVSGITLDYCGAGTNIIADNILNNVTSGITVIHSSPYIARNSITGSTSTGTGLFLDNANGTIKYNQTNNFTYSLSGNYSSPYLSYNIFTNASDKGIYLKTSSVPVMKPIYSAGVLYWLGGSNTITGTPSTAGMWFGTDAYPLLDSGYNTISVNGSNYLSGTIPSICTGVLQATLNNWYDRPPDTTKFSVSSGRVSWDPEYDGVNYPASNGFTLNSIGFSEYDTVYTITTNNPQADVLYIQAYTAENQKNYTTAITKYETIVNNYYSSSPYASISLSRIFNCLEKNGSTANDYLQIRNYYTQIKNNSSYSNEIRETSEDLAIKAKFKQGLMDEAISDYNTMYQQNMNTPKGVHALINEECLEAMRNDSSGNSLQHRANISAINHHIHNLYSLIYGDGIFKNTNSTHIIPAKFELYQNYPNPFNPTTTIKFDVPDPVQVNIKIYDLLGREVWSYKEFKTAGRYSVSFDGSNLASGIYFYRIEAGKFVQSKKMVLVK